MLKEGGKEEKQAFHQNGTSIHLFEISLSELSSSSSVVEGKVSIQIWKFPKMYLVWLGNGESNDNAFLNYSVSFPPNPSMVSQNSSILLPGPSNPMTHDEPESLGMAQRLSRKFKVPFHILYNVKEDDNRKDDANDEISLRTRRFIESELTKCIAKTSWIKVLLFSKTICILEFSAIFMLVHV